MTEPIDREAVRRRARARAERMGLAVRPEPEPTPTPDALLGPLTRHPGALRAMLITGRLTNEQAAAARTFLADLAAAERQNTTDTTGDAA